MGPSRGYLLVTFLLVISPCLSARPLERVANTTIRMPLELRPTGYRTVPAFPGVPFNTVVGFATPPGETNRLFVLEKVGRIVVITNLTAPNRTVFFDISSRVDSTGEAGLLGLAFHPNFQKNHLFFVFYTAQAGSEDLDGQPLIGLHDRLSRFQLYPNNPNRGDETSEQNLISQYDRASNHNGGDIHFGPDGYLYVSLGDEGGGNDQFGNSQRIDRNFFSGMLRIDVDIRPGSKPPNPHGAITVHYGIPPDNPFIGLTSFNNAAVEPGKVRTEFWAVGLRNPWRFSFDPFTGDLLCGDVGQGSREEVNLIQRGGNYGWNYAEGSLAFGMFPPGFTDIKPIAEYQRPGVSMELERQGYCVIGGVVYRGSRMPELFGKYIFGDWGTGLYWSLQHNGTEATEFMPLFAGPSMNCFGIDPGSGDILIGNESVLRLIPDVVTREPPPTLAETGVFIDAATLSPALGVVAYDLNVPFWSDHARKRRWFSVPNPALAMTFRPEANWSFPMGSVWIKHFDLEMIRGIPESARRIETRVLVKTSDGVYGVTYRWGASTDNATLVPGEGMDEEFLIEVGGSLHRQVWHYPGRSECLACHTSAGGYVLGFNTAQINRAHGYPEGAANQLKALSDAGYFTTGVSHPENFLRLAAANDSTASLEHRARSYLAANCVQCHQPGATASGHWDARIHVPIAKAGLINGVLNNDGGNSEAKVIRQGSLEDSMLLTRINHRGPGQMPPLSSTLIDEESVNLISDWITSTLMRPPGESITLAVDGFGSIRGLTNGQLLESGRSLTVTAMPDAGQLFSYWTGTILSSTNPLRFQMQSGITLTANFVTNRFLELQGAYQGLIHAPDAGGAFAFGSGGFNGTVNSVGAYSLRLELAGQRTAVTGRFGANGRATNQLANQILGPLRLELAFTATHGVDLTGRVVGSNWVAGITGVRSHPRDPIEFTWTTDTAASPPLLLGDAFGTIRVDRAGRARMQGRLATGEQLTHSTVMSEDGRLPIFLNGQRSSAIGWIQPAENGRALSGVLTWSNTESDTPLWVNVPIVGSIHTKDYSFPAGTPIHVIFSGGGLTSVMSNSVVVDASKLRGTSSVPPMVSARMDWRSGLFSGQFSSEDYRPRSFRGAVLQEYGYGVGYFQGPSGSGRVLLRF